MATGNKELRHPRTLGTQDSRTSGLQILKYLNWLEAEMATKNNLKNLKYLSTWHMSERELHLNSAYSCPSSSS